MKRFVTPNLLNKLTIVLLSLFFAVAAHAQATLSVQGVLTKSDGTAVDDDTYTITFKLFDAPTGGNEVHSEPIDVETIGGVYSVILGLNNAYPLNAPFNTIYYLSVRIGSQELLPRPQITHAPYALSLLGQNNKFPSTGMVTVDAIQAENAGYSFKGENNSGMTKNGTGDIILQKGGTSRINIGNNGTNYLSGPTEIVGNQTVTGASNIQGGQTVSGGQTVNGGLTANNGSNSCIVDPNYTYSAKRFLSSWIGYGGGYSFIEDTGHDSGMFGYDDGFFALLANGSQRMAIGSNTVISNSPGHTEVSAGTDIILSVGPFSNYYLNNLPAKTSGNWKNLIWDFDNHRLAWENSSRRYKINIKPLEDDFSLILKSQPRVYSRYDGDTTYHEVGYIAEEMDSIGLHRLVEHDQYGEITGFDYSKMILYVTEVVKMQHNDIETLQAQVAALQAENEKLQTENTALKADLGQQYADQNARLDALTKRLNALENSGLGNNRK
ncbi:MAG: tail fiber domain-containing protein [Lewinellaceae bacterium]|nr:tail fiber domain-containing protein [Lewinellaceae bacterium]